MFSWYHIGASATHIGEKMSLEGEWGAGLAMIMDADKPSYLHGCDNSPHFQ
jgi:hypothetical protein